VCVRALEYNLPPSNTTCPPPQGKCVCVCVRALEYNLPPTTTANVCVFVCVCVGNTTMRT